MEKQVKNIQSVHRALDILEYVINSGDGKKLSEITEHCGLNKTTAFHIIKTLEGRGYIEQSPDSLKYKTGGKLFTLSHNAYQKVNLNQICQPHMERLVQAFNESVCLYHYARIDQRIEGLCIYYLDSDNPVRISVSIGRWVPLYCTAVGKLYLSGLREDRLTEELATQSFESLTQHTVRTCDELREQLVSVRRQGCCVEREEYEEGVVNIAVPIYKYSGRVIAAICITLPTQRATQELVQSMQEMMLPMSRELSALPL